MNTRLLIIALGCPLMLGSPASAEPPKQDPNQTKANSVEKKLDSTQQGQIDKMGRKAPNQTGPITGRPQTLQFKTGRFVIGQ
jgi:hypothetical protein